jgi:dihydroorotate dehydrogenase
MTQDTNERMALCHNIPKKPIVIKISPLSSYEDGDPRQADLSLEALEFIMDICLEKKVDGVTATNTTKEHIGIPE